MDIESAKNQKENSNENLEKGSLENQERFEDLEKGLEDEIENSTEEFKNTDSNIEKIEKSVNLANTEDMKVVESEMNVTQTLSDLDQKAEHLKNETRDEVKKISMEAAFPRAAANELGEEYLQHDINLHLATNPDQGNMENVFMKNFVTLVTKEEYSSNVPYKRSEHRTINGLLREGKEVNIENVLKYKNKEINDFNIEMNNDIVECYQQLLDSADKSYLKVGGSGSNEEVFRFMKGVDFLKNVNVGDTVMEKGFLSTSVDPTYRDHYQNDEEEATILTMRFPKNSVVNGMLLGGVEKEFLMPPGVSYEIKSKEVVEVNGVKKTLITVEFLPSKYVHMIEEAK